MKLGVSIPNNWGMEDASKLVDAAVLADDLGFASLWTSEHLVNNAYVRKRIGERPYYHPLTILSAIASRTSQVELGTSVIVVPFHHPFDVAKYVATLDQLSKGRVILGVGVGNVPDEFEALAIPWNQRGATTDESIDVMQKLWSAGAASHTGRKWNFQDVHTSPKPWQGRRLPIWVGGMSEAAYRRVVRVGDGWQPTAISAEEFRDTAARLRDMASAAGRDPDCIDLAMRFNVALDDVEVTDVELRSTVLRGDTQRMLDTCKAFEEAGATHFIYALNAHEMPILEDALQQLAEYVLPYFKQGA